MNNKRNFGAVGATVVAAFSLSGLLMLSACEERPYPKPVKTYAEAPKAPPAQLYGAPAATPPAYAPPAYTPPPIAYAPPPQPVYPPQSQRTYAYDAPAIVAMAPIPNPGDEYGAAPYRHGRRVHPQYAAAPEPTYNDGYAPKPPRPVYHKSAHPAYTPKPTPPVYAAKPVAPKPNTYAQKGAAVGAAAGAATGVVAKNAKPDAKAIAATAKAAYNDRKAPAAAPVTPAKVGQDVKAAAVATVAAAKVAGKDAVATTKTATADAKAAYNANKPGAIPAAPAPATGADRSTRLAALQSALTDAVSKGAGLKAPDRFTANQPADVTLTVPASFADTLRTEAQKNGLSDAAASVNLTAVLSGDGFSVTPDETQSQPLTVGQETTFRWTVTAQPGAKGPLHADVGADLLGGGSDTLALGSVQKAAGLGVKLTPRVVGAAILVLILALVVVWLARGRGGPSRPASARRASRNARGSARPLDMGEGSAH
jgi:hypothetical protein